MLKLSQKNHCLSGQKLVIFRAFTALFFALSTLLLLTTYYLLLTTETQAATGINQQLNYQGKLADSNSIAVSDGTYSIKFVIYDAASGGNCLWTALGACDTNDYKAVSVTTNNGVFSVTLGGTGQNSLATSSIDWNSDSLYLGVTVESDSEMTPRRRLTSVAYAFNADTVDGFHATSTATASQLLSLDSDKVLNLGMSGGVSSTFATTSSYLAFRPTSTPDGMTGRIYYSSNDNTLYVYDGTTWQDALVTSKQAWQEIWTGAITPTTTNAGVYVTASSTIANLRTDKATTTGNLIVGTSLWDAPSSTLTVDGTLYVTNKATTSDSLWLGTGGTADNLDLSGGDLYVQDDVEIDDDLFVTDGATFGRATSSDRLYVTTDLAVATTTPWAGYELAVTGDGVFSGDMYVVGGGEFGRATSTDRLYVAGDLAVATTTPYAGAKLAVTGNVVVNGDIISDGNLLVKNLGQYRVERSDGNTANVLSITASDKLKMGGITGNVTPIGIFENGSELITLDNSKVGISATAPAYKLEVSDPTATTTLYVVGGSRLEGSVTTTNRLYVATDLTVATSTPWTGYELAVTGDGVFSGDMYVVGGIESNSATVTDTLYLGSYLQFTETGDNYLYFDNNTTNYLAWDDSADEFVYSNDLKVTGKTTSTVSLWVGSGGTPSYLDFTGGDLYVQGDLEVASGATTTYFAISSLTNCDTIDTDANGVLICGTDETGGGGAWEKYTGFGNLEVITPTTTNASIYVSGRTTSTLGLWLGTGGTADNLDLSGGDLYVQDGAEIDGGLWVSSVTTTNRLYVQNDLAVATTTPYAGAKLAVTGDAVFDGNATVTGALAIGGGTLYLNSSSITATGDLTIDTASKTTFSDNVVISGNATTSGYLVVGTTNPTTDMSAGDLLVSGSATTTGSLYVTDDLTTAGNLEVGTYGDIPITDSTLFLHHFNNTTIPTIAASPEATLTTGNLSGIWHFEEGTASTTADISGNANDLTLAAGNASPVWTANGKYGSALDLDGVNDYISRADDADFDFGTGDFTIGGWIKPDALDGFIFAKYESSTLKWEMRLLTTGIIAVYVGDGTDTFSHGSTATLSVDNWYFVAGTWDASTETLSTYVRQEGQLGEYTSTTNDPVDIDSLDNIASLVIGERSGVYYDGITDELFILKGTALTEDELDMLYNNRWWGRTYLDGKFGQGYYAFDSSSLSYSTTDNIIQDQGTIEMWVKPSFGGGDNANHVFFDLETASDTNRLTLYKSSANNLVFEIYDSGGNASTTSYSVANSASDFATSTWYHLAATWTKTGLELYKDGVLLDDTESGTGTGLITQLASTMYIGRDATSQTNETQAIIDELRISDRALTAEEIKRSYLSDFEHFDVAEHFQSGDSLEAGDLVVLDTSLGRDYVARTDIPYNPLTIGVVSTQPGIVLGGKNYNPESRTPIALAGRVPVKVTDINGPIQAGDLLTSSRIPGHAMRATDSSMGVIGMALESFSGGTGKIMMLIKQVGSSLGQTLAPPIQGPHYLDIDLTSLSTIDSLYVTDTLATQKLMVEEAAQFNGTIVVIGEAGFESKVTFYDHVYFNGDIAGTATILANTTSTEVVFDKEYRMVPKVNVTPQDRLAGREYWVSDKSTKGFRINVEPLLNSDLDFDWLALAVSTDSQSQIANSPDEESPPNPPNPNNHRPIIEDFIISPDNVVSGEAVELWLKASDIDGDELTYSWSDGNKGGNFSGDSGLVYYTYTLKDSELEAYIPITVVVSDGYDQTYLTYKLHINGGSDNLSQNEPIPSMDSGQEESVDQGGEIEEVAILEEENPEEETSNEENIFHNEEATAETVILSEAKDLDEILQDLPSE